MVLSLIFLKFASDKFEARRAELIAEGKEKYLDMVGFYAMKNVFYLPEESRWSFIQTHAKQDDIATRNRKGETLFFDARNMGSMMDRTHKELTDDDIKAITKTYHAWRGEILNRHNFSRSDHW